MRLHRESPLIGHLQDQSRPGFVCCSDHRFQAYPGPFVGPPAPTGAVGSNTKARR